jgi:hypothetical protein
MVKGSGRRLRMCQPPGLAGVRKPPKNEPAGVSALREGAMEIWPLGRARVGNRESGWGGRLGGRRVVAGWIDGRDGD